MTTAAEIEGALVDAIGTASFPGSDRFTRLLAQQIVGVEQGFAYRPGDVVNVFAFISSDRHAGLLARTDTADCSVEIQAAIDAVEAAGGGTLLFPPALMNIASGLTSTGRVRFAGSGMMGPGASASQATSPATTLNATAAMTAMLTIQAGTADHWAWYAEVEGIYFAGANVAERLVWVRSGRQCVLDAAGERATIAGFHFDDGNGVLTAYNHMPRLNYQAGSNAACFGSHGLVIEASSGGVNGGTRFYGGSLNLIAGKNGVGLLLRDLDASYFAFVSAGNNSTGTGYGVVFDTLTDTTYGTSQTRPPRKNYIGWVNGHVLARAESRNVIGWLNSEPSSVTLEANTSLHYAAIDRNNGMRFETRSYTMSDRIAAPLYAYRTQAGTVTEVGTAGAALPALRFAATGTNVASWSIPVPATWSEGLLTGLRIAFNHPTSVADGNVVIQTGIQLRVPGAGLGSGVNTISHTVAVVGASNNVATVTTLTLDSAHTVTDETALLNVRVGRLGDDAADTLADTLDILSVELLFEADGPHSDPTPQWDVPVDVVIE
jgi:hypothetical protein